MRPRRRSPAETLAAPPVATAAHPPAASRVAVIGDVGGHHRELVAELRRLGVDTETGVVPPDLRIVQVGDLVHRGPDSEQVVFLVDRCLRACPDRWVQLIGNHEAHYVRPPDFFWPRRIDFHAVDVLRHWWRAGRLRAATVVSGAGGDLLVTHAGLTVGFWEEVLGRPSSAREAVAALDALASSGSDELFRTGSMLGGGPPRLDAGPLWARAATELVPPWADRPLPFGQLHGHSSVYDWQRGVFRVGPELAARTSLNPDGGHETTRLDGGEIIGVDPGHGTEAHVTWHAWMR